MEEKNAAMLELTTHVVAAFVGNNRVAVAEVPDLVRVIYAALAGAETPAPKVVDEALKPSAGQIRKSITPYALISFIDGKSYMTLKRHLTTHRLTVSEYRDRFGLPNDYPTTAPTYSAARRAMAKSLGLGQSGRKPKAPSKAAKARAKNA